MYRIALTLLCASVAVGCEEPPPRDAPVPLVGMWATDAPSHADRFLEFGTQTITFGTGDHGSVTHLIDGVTASPGEGADATHYEISYLDSEGERSRIGFTYRATRPLPSLVLDHRDEKWFPRIHRPGERPK
jgi:hypothetical protein